MNKRVTVQNLSANEIHRWRMARWKGRTDLGYLCREILNYKDVRDDVHGPVMNILQKFPIPNRIQFEEHDKLVNSRWYYSPLISMTALPGKRRRLILDPRGHLKTTINAIAHTIQWILNYPDTAGVIFQSNLDKACQILKEIKAHFQYNEKFRTIYPEYCPQKRIDDFGIQSEFTVPARSLQTARKEGTLTALSIGAGTSGMHFDFMKFSDVVEPSNTGTPEQIEKINTDFWMAENLLVAPRYWIDVEGTRHDFCLVGSTKILMSDWQHKNISELKVGDEVVGWELTSVGRRLKPSKILGVTSFEAPVKTYYFESGESITCTDEHKFWRGKQWKKNNKNFEYGKIKRLKSVRRLLTPTEANKSRDAAWLAGFYDGEGSFQQNVNNPSGTITITQASGNMNLIEETRRVLTALNFSFSECWHKPSIKGQAHWKDRCVFKVCGGWKERYRFLVEVAPCRNQRIKNSLFTQLFTTQDKIIRVEDAGVQTVYAFQCETGNYVANGCCSKNSDLYGRIIDLWLKDSVLGISKEDRQWDIHVRGCYKKKMPDKAEPRYDPDELDLPDIILENGEKDPVWNDPDRGFCYKSFEEKRRNDPVTFASQQLNSPIGDASGHIIFPVNHLYPKWIKRDDFKNNVPIAYREFSIDTAETDGKRSNSSAIVVGAWSGSGRLYIEAIDWGKWLPDEFVLRLTYNYLKYKPVNIILEETAFVRGLMVSIKMWESKNVPLPITLRKLDNQTSKKARITNTLQPVYNSQQGDIRFLDDIEVKAKEQMLKEFRQHPRFSEDDIIDAIAQLYREKDYYGRLKARPTPQQEVDKRFAQFLMIDDPWDGDAVYSRPQDMPEVYKRTGGL